MKLRSFRSRPAAWLAALVVCAPAALALPLPDAPAEEAWERAVVVLPEEADLTVPLHAPVPGDAPGIGPGSKLLITMQDSPGKIYLCTANFLWEDGGTTYLGAAGHCFIPTNKKATHGPGADYDRNRTRVRVCASNCLFGGQAGGVVVGGTVFLGAAVAYARQTGAGGDVGNDFGVVEIPASLVGQTRASMPVWGGPSSVHSGNIANTPLCFYGNAMGFGETIATKARAGLGVSNGAAVWRGHLPSFQGDSGSAVVTCGAHADGVHGIGAVGVLTHIQAGVGAIVGTNVARAKTMAMEAGLNLTVKLAP